MIMPSKTVTPANSLFCISPYVIKAIFEGSDNVDSIYEYVRGVYPKNINAETILLSLNYLYMIGKVEIDNEAIKVKC